MSREEPWPLDYEELEKFSFKSDPHCNVHNGGQGFSLQQKPPTIPTVFRKFSLLCLRTFSPIWATLTFPDLFAYLSPARVLVVFFPVS